MDTFYCTLTHMDSIAPHRFPSVALLGVCIYTRTLGSHSLSCVVHRLSEYLVRYVPFHFTYQHSYLQSLFVLGIFYSNILSCVVHRLIALCVSFRSSRLLCRPFNTESLAVSEDPPSFLKYDPGPSLLRHSFNHSKKRTCHCICMYLSLAPLILT